MNRYFTILLLSLFVASCSEETTPSISTSKKSLNVDGYVVKSEAYSENLTVVAKLLPFEQVEIMANITGQVLDIAFKDGQKVSKGQLLVRMDDRQWRAELIGVLAELDALQKDYDRKKELLEVEGSSKEEVESLFSKIEILKSKIQQINLNIELANIRAPFRGTIGLKNLSEGAYLKSGEVITTLNQLNQLKVDFSLPQEFINSIKVGSKVEVLVNNEVLIAEVYAMDPSIDAVSRSIHVRALLKQDANFIMPGTFSEVNVKTKFNVNAMLVPSQAIVPQINEQTIYLVKNGIVQRNTVETGDRTTDRVLVVKGVELGDTVITTGLLMIKEGMKVKFLKIY